MKNRIKFILFIGSFFFAFQFISNLAFADASRFSILHHRYSFNQADFINSLGSVGLEKGDLLVGTSLEFAEKPIEFNRSDVSGKVQSVNRFLIQHFNLDYGFSKKWSFGIDFPVVWFNSFRPPEAVNNDLSTKTVLGDLFFQQRFTISSRNENKWGFAVSNFLTFPTGNENFFMGYERVTGGLLLILDKNLSKKISFGLNFGFDAHPDHELLDIDHNSHFISSLGFNFLLSDRFDLKTNLKSRTPFSEFFTQEKSTQVEGYVDIGVKSKSQKFRINLLGGVPVVKAVGVPVFRAQLGASYKFDLLN